MKTSLNGARLGANDFTLTQFIDLAAHHDFDGIDFGIGSAMKTATELGGVNALKDYMTAKGVAPAVFGLDVEWRKDEATFEQGMASLKEKAEFANHLGCERCTTWMPSSTNMETADWVRLIERRFGLIGRVLEEADVRFGLEWVGPHHLRAGGANQMGANPAIFTMADTLAVIRDIGLPTVGLLVDCYHTYTTGIGEAEISQLTDQQIVHVHINDAQKGVGWDGAKDGERVLPGEGEIDLAGFLRGLRAAGYQGYVATEVLAPANLAPTPDEAAAKVRAAMRGVGV
jgi:sugar phosphate isomerase/epimerase